MWTMVHGVIFQAVPIQLLQTTDPNACFDDGSCIISTTCNKPTPTGLHVIDIHNRARLSGII